MIENLREQFLFLPDYLSGHVLLTVSAMAAGIVISIPLGILVTQVPRLRTGAIAIVSVIQTIPTLALLAIMLTLYRTQIGFLPAFTAVTLYSMLPMVRNTVTGLENADPNAVEAARGLGMTNFQTLMRVRLPLAVPVIVAGIRTATVWTVGIATIATLIGATTLGNYILTGIQTRNQVALIFGSLLAAALALLLELLMAAIQRVVERRAGAVPLVARARFLQTAGAVSGIVLLCLTVYAVSTRIPTSKDRVVYVIAGKPFTEQHIMTRLMADHLQAAGYEVDVRMGLGSTVAFDATANNAVDCYVEYTGTVWANYMNREDNPGREPMRRRVVEWLEQEHGVVTIGLTGFENRYALAMRRDRARELGVQSVTDLVPYADDLVIGSDIEFFNRPEWIRLRDTYDIDFQEKLSFDPALMYKAVYDGGVDVITAYTTDGRVAAYDLSILDDPLDALLPYDGLILASPDAAADPGFRDALEPIVNNISSEEMRHANKLVDVDGKTIQEAADYLAEMIKND